MDIEDKDRIVQFVKSVTFLLIYFGWKPIGNFLITKFPTSNVIKILFSDKVKKHYFYLSVILGFVFYMIFAMLNINEGLFMSLVLGFFTTIFYVNVRNKELIEYANYEDVKERLEICKDCKTDYVITEERLLQGYFVCSRCGRKNLVK